MTREKLFSVTMKDCDMQTFRVSGAGGQHRDKTSAGVRIVHRASGANGQCGENREQSRNKKVAFRRMAESVTFQSWCHAKMRGLAPISEVVDDLMRDENLLVEYL